MRIFSIMPADAGAYQTYAASVLQGGVAWDKFAPAQHIPVDAPLITCGALHTVGAVGRYGVGGASVWACSGSAPSHSTVASTTRKDNFLISNHFITMPSVFF